MQERGLIDLYLEAEQLRITLRQVEEKVNLDDSSISAPAAAAAGGIAPALKITTKEAFLWTRFWNNTKSWNSRCCPTPPALDKTLLFKAFQFANDAHRSRSERTAPPISPIPWRWPESWPISSWTWSPWLPPSSTTASRTPPITHEDLVREFTPAIADLVEGVTKLTRINYVSMEEKQMENLRKMLVAMNKDIRVILVKLCDRLHNMRTMQYQSPKKQREKS